jgi:hypothetical protein
VRSPRFRLAVLIGLTLVVQGCASLRQESCEQFEERRKQTNYATQYTFEGTKVSAEAKPLGKNDLAVAPRYEMTLDNDHPRPCSHVKLRKELTLMRRDNADLIFEETREFFTNDGKRIAEKKEVLTGQLDRSGRYSAFVPLPIPKNAPAGKYRVVSTLVLKTKGSTKTQLLGRTAAVLEVTPPTPSKPKK